MNIVLVVTLERMSLAILTIDIRLKKYEFCDSYKKNKLALLL